MTGREAADLAAARRPGEPSETVPYRRNLPWRLRARFDLGQVADHLLRPLAGRTPRRARDRTAFRERLVAHLATGERGRRFPVPRITRSEFDRNASYHLRRELPIVIEGAATEWECLRSWSFDELKRRYGDEQVPVNIDGEPVEARFESVIEMIEARMGHYLSFLPLLEMHPELLEELDHRWLSSHVRPLSFARDFQVFIGHERTMTRIHNNIRMNLFVQVLGEKRWVFYPNYYRAVLDPRLRETARYPEHADHDPFEPDRDPPAGYEYIDTYETTLREGDVLFNPPYVWHTVKNYSLSLGVGYRWIDLGRAVAGSPLYAMLDVVLRWPPFLKLGMQYRKDMVRATFDRADGRLGPLSPSS